MLIQTYKLQIIEKKFKVEKNMKIRERLQIILFLRRGYTQREISDMLQISVGLVPYWKKRFEKESFEGLKDKEGRGVKKKMIDEELSMLRSALEEPISLENGYSRGWQSKDIRVFLMEEFKISFTRQYVNRLLHSLGISLQVPRPKHKRRNQQAVNEFKADLKKNLKIWAPT